MVFEKRNCITVFSLAALLATTATAFAQQAIEIKFDKLDPEGAAKLGYFPVQVKLSSEKPASIKKEPTYAAKPKYGTITLGDGPNSTYVIAVDEPDNADYKIYLDANQNGDLTDDGNGAWSKKNDNRGRVMYGINHYVLNASYSTTSKQLPYGVSFYRFVGQDYLLMYRTAAWTGKATIDGKTHNVMLAENDANGIYSKPLDDAGKPVKGIASRPVWLLIDTKDTGTFQGGETIDIRSPFKLNNVAYEANVDVSGSSVKLTGTTRKVADKPKAPERPALLAAGVTAPDFESEAYGGGICKLSDYKGKIVILDFWATWCGPCQLSMPHIEKVYKAVKDQNVVVLGVCVWDTKPEYEKWVPANSSKYTFKFSFDPAGNADNNIAKAKYKVSGIPTTYVIDKEGKVAAAIVGYEDKDTRLEESLKKLGVNVTNLK